MDWSREMSLTLVRLYREKDSLWNPQNQEHYQKWKRNEAWTAVAGELTAMFGKPVSMNDCKRKMDCILSSFRREKIRVKRIYKEKGEEAKSTWFLFEALSFLMDKGVYRAAPISLSTPVPHPQYDIRSVSDPPPKICRRQPENERLEEIPKVVDMPIHDECYSFGVFVANKLRRYSGYTRSAVQHAISDILFNADMGYYERARSSSVNTQTEISQYHLFRRGGINQQTQDFKHEEVSDVENESVLN